MDKIRVLLADDHTIVRKGLLSILEKETGIDVVAEAEDGREAIQKSEALHPDVVVMDIAMPGLNGLEATRQLKKQFPDIKVIILTVHENEEYVLQTLRSGASGYLIKKAAPADLIKAIREVYQGKSFLSPSISKTVIDEYIRRADKMEEGEDSQTKLTHRETEVLQMIAEGFKSREIAKRLFVSIKTVDTHRANIREKLNIHSTADLVQYAIHKGLIIKDL